MLLFSSAEKAFSPERTETPDMSLLERHSPLGAESEDEDTTKNEVVAEDQILEMNGMGWDNWEDNDPGEEIDRKQSMHPEEEHEQKNTNNVIDVVDILKEHQAHKNANVQSITTLDLNSLDIKVSGGAVNKAKTTKDDHDFFTDMEPSIPKPLGLMDMLEENGVEINDKSTSHTCDEKSSKFAVATLDLDTEIVGDAWGDDDWADGF